MHQYLIGQYYAEAGMEVINNLSWYRRNGLDKDGLHPRLFEIRKLWPNLNYLVAGKNTHFYSRHFSVQKDGMYFPLRCISDNESTNEHPYSLAHLQPPRPCPARVVCHPRAATSGAVCISRRSAEGCARGPG